MADRLVEPNPDEPRRSIAVRQWCPYGHGFLGTDADELRCAECERRYVADLERARATRARVKRLALLVVVAVVSGALTRAAIVALEAGS